MNLTAQLTLDQTQFARGMQMSRTEMETLARVARTSGQQTDQSLRAAGTAAGISAERVQELQRYLQRANQSAQDTSQGLRRIQVPNDAQRDLQRLARELGNVEQAAQQADQQMGQIGQNAGAQGQSAGADLGGGIEGGLVGKLKGLGGKGGPIAMALVGVASVGLAAGALLAKGIADGLQMQQDAANVQAKFGLDAETMKRVGKAAGDSYKAAFGESVQGQSEIIAQGIQLGFLSMKSTNSEMADFANQIDTVNQMLGGETQETMMALNAMVKSGLVPNAETAMDLIVKAAGSNHLMIDDLTESLKQYASGWKQTGFSAEFSLGLVSQSMDLGSDSTDRAGDAIREFGRRLYEETDTIQETLDGLEGMGESTDSLIKKFKAGGPEAEAAFDTVFDAIRKIEDPLDRANAAQALLGDTAGDFINVFTQWDPSEAAKKMEEWEGATKSAAETMGGTGQASLTSAMRSIEVSGNGVKVALAEAFGPQLTKLADWVTTHQGEITQFFTDLGVGVLDCLIAFSKFASGTIGLLSEWYGAIAPIVGGAIGMFGGMSEKIGSIIKHIPGMEDTGKAMEGAGSAAQWYAEQMKAMPGRFDAAKTAIDGFIPGLESARDKLESGGREAANTAKLMTALGQTVVSLPDGHTITLDSNDPEVMQRLQALGLQVESLPDGQFKVTANTAEGQQILNDFIKNNNNKKINLQAEVALSTRVQNGELTVGPGSAWASKQADGGIYRQAQITDKPILWGEAGPEAYVPLGQDKRPRSVALLGQVADMFGFSLTKMADGGIVGSLDTLAKSKFPKLQLTSGQRDTNDYHGTGQAADFSNGSGNTDEQLEFANYLADNHLSDLLELIYIDPRFGRTVKNGKFVSDDFWGAENVAAHRNHVHVALKNAISAQGKTEPKAGTPRTSRQQIVDEIVKAGQEMGMSEEDIAAGVATGLVESELQDLPDAPNSEYDSDGVFQQRPSMGWGSADDSVAKDAKDFFEKYKETDPSMSPGDRAQAVQRSAFPDKYAERMAEATGLVQESMANSASSSPSTPSDTLAGSPSDSQTTPGTSGGSVQDVRVTNWPNKIADDPGTDTQTDAAGKPVARMGLAFYADGAMLGPGDGMRVWNEPEAGGESYIPHASGKRGRATGILAATARKFGYQLVPNGAQFFAEGGFGAGGGGSMSAFGGYSNHADDFQWGPHGLGDMLALGFGGAMSIASMFSHVPGMLSSGELDLGSALGSGIDTGANSIPGFDQVLSKLDEMVSTLKESNGGVVIEYAQINDPQELIAKAAEAFKNSSGLTLPTIQMGG